MQLLFLRSLTSNSHLLVLDLSHLSGCLRYPLSLDNGNFTSQLLLISPLGSRSTSNTRSICKNYQCLWTRRML